MAMILTFALALLRRYVSVQMSAGVFVAHLNFNHLWRHVYLKHKSYNCCQVELY